MGEVVNVSPSVSKNCSVPGDSVSRGMAPHLESQDLLISIIPGDTSNCLSLKVPDVSLGEPIYSI